MKQLLAIYFFVCATTFTLAQSQFTPSSTIYNDIERLGNTITVMYIAAHPDDENTQMITWLTHHKKMNAVYLSLTRGDGGQNLVGTEKSELLGLIRTQELLEARNIDGGQQWFTRANDFGFSKTATETLSIWNEDEVLSDVVWAIRKHQPSIIITRFDPDSNGRTHGHHTSSALLAVKAFDLAGDKTAYPEQLKFVEPWQPVRLYFNTNWWFYGSQEKFDAADKSNMVSVDIGQYYASEGASNNEIAAQSRSQHASQGFGSALQRGTDVEWLELLKGEKPKTNNPFEGIDTSFNNQKINSLIAKAKKEFDVQEPSAITPTLIKTARAIDQLPTSTLKTRKQKEVQDLLLKVNGFYGEWTTKSAYGTIGDTVETEFEIINRSKNSIQVSSPNFKKQKLSFNEPFAVEIPYTILSNAISTPYWLSQEQESIGMYNVNNQELVGKPENEQTIVEPITININGYEFEKELPLQSKSVLPAKGEEYQPFYVVPAVAVNFSNPVYVFADSKPQAITVEVTAFKDNVSGTVQLDAGLQWLISENQSFSIAHAGGKQKLTFQIIPPLKQSEANLRASAKVSEQSFFNSVVDINYPHINRQLLFVPASTTVQKINMVVPNVKVGYVQGSGDTVPEALQQVGVEVVEFLPEQITAETLAQFDVIVLGIRALNTQPELEFKLPLLWEFAKRGGRVISQYNTNRSLVTDDIAPYDLILGRGRITEEDAALTFLAPTHQLLNKPNKITDADFDNWEQERGLYFAQEWSKEFTPILAGHDKDEKDLQGMLLVAPVGEGEFIYTGLSFFRQLPAGVPGAYRLLMNLIAADEE